MDSITVSSTATTSASTAAVRRRLDKSYGTTPIKRIRRTKASLNRLCDDLYKILAECQPATIRQVYYLAVSAGLIDKTEASYKNVVCRLLAIMRRDGRIPFDWLVDNTRLMRKPRTYSGLAAMLQNSCRTYRKALWDDQDAYVEIWSEKDAISGVLSVVTHEWDVPLMISRGFASLSFLHSAAEAITDNDKPTFIYYFGDHDPSGVQIDRTIESTLREFAPTADITFNRVAVTAEQIEEFNLPTRPTKKSDSRCKTFTGESVEVDAIPPAKLREIANKCIVAHVDDRRLARTIEVEAAERDTLRMIAQGFGGDE